MAKQVSPGVLALRKVVDDVYKEAREAKARGELVGWSSSKFPCEFAEAFGLHVMYPENQAAGIAATVTARSSVRQPRIWAMTTISADTPASALPMRLESARPASLTRRPANTSSTPAPESP